MGFQEAQSSQALQKGRSSDRPFFLAARHLTLVLQGSPGLAWVSRKLNSNSTKGSTCLSCYLCVFISVQDSPALRASFKCPAQPMSFENCTRPGVLYRAQSVGCRIRQAVGALRLQGSGPPRRRDMPSRQAGAIVPGKFPGRKLSTTHRHCPVRLAFPSPWTEKTVLQTHRKVSRRRSHLPRKPGLPASR